MTHSADAAEVEALELNMVEALLSPEMARAKISHSEPDGAVRQCGMTAFS